MLNTISFKFLNGNEKDLVQIIASDGQEIYLDVNESEDLLCKILNTTSKTYKLFTP